MSDVLWQEMASLRRRLEKIRLEMADEGAPGPWLASDHDKAVERLKRSHSRLEAALEDLERESARVRRPNSPSSTP